MYSIESDSFITKHHSTFPALCLYSSLTITCVYMLQFVTEEHDSRLGYESQIREDVEERWQELQKTQDDSLRAVKDLQKVCRCQEVM